MKPKPNAFLPKSSLVATLVLSTCCFSHAATYQWGGATSNDWTVASNWTTGTGLTAGPAPSNVSAAHRLNVNNNTGNGAVYTSAQGTTSYGSSTVRGLAIGSAAANANAVGLLTITGGTFSSVNATGSSGDVIGNGATNSGTLTVNGGNFIGAAAGTGMGIGGGPTSTLNVLAGTATLTTLNLNNTTGTININGGTLALNNISRTFGTNTINLNGGTLQARQNNTAFIAASINAINAVSSSTIDTNGFDVSINSAISGSATINKISAGKLTLTANNPYSGNIAVNSGTVALAPTAITTFAGSISGGGALEIGGSSTVNLTGTNTHTGGTTVLGGTSLGGEGSLSGSLTFAGTHNFFFNPGTTGTNEHFRAGSVDASAATITIVPSASASGSGIVVMEAAGGITGTIGTNFLGNSRLTLSFNPGNTQLLAAVTPATLKWTGTDATNPTFWDNGVTSNWDNGGSADVFVAGDNVLFDDSASMFNVAIQSPVNTGNITFNNTGFSDYTVSGAAIGGSGSLTKTGDAFLYLNTANTYSGTTTITDGTLVAGNNAALGDAAGGTIVSGTGVLDINNKNLGTEVITISGSGSGSGALINTGADRIDAIGRLILSGNATIGGSGRWDLRNSSPTLNMGTGPGAPFKLTKASSNYVGLVGVSVTNPGNIDVTEGTFSVQTTTALGGSSSNTFTVQNGATLSSWQAANPTTWSLDLKNGATLRSESAANSAQNIWSGPVTLEAAGTVTVQGDATMTISGNISGTGSAISKTGTGVAFISGANSYTGLTTVNAGSLVLQNPSALGTTAAGTSVATTGRVELDNLSIAGENVSISGDGGNFWGALQGRSGSSVWTGNVSVEAAFTRIGAQAGATLEVSGVISSPANHDLVFRPADATSTVVLTGANTYTGATSIIGGVVSVGNIGSMGGGPSNLGSPTSTAAATLKIGSGATGTLRYTGSGETTNRVIDLQGTITGAIIDQSGTGPLKFTSDLTATGVGSKTFVLQGSTAGTGEIAGAIVDNSNTGSTTLSANFAAAATTITLNSVVGITAGAPISGTGIAAGTTVSAVNAGTRVVTLSAATTAAGTAGSSITVTGVTNPTGLRKDGTGTWTTSGANTFTGGVTINGGVLKITNSSGLGSGPKTITINASADKWLELDGSSGNITLPSDMNFQTSGINGAIRNSAGDNVINGAITMTLGNGNTKIVSDNAGSLTLNGNIAANTTTRALDLGGDSIANNTFNGVLSNASSPALTKTGVGKWILNGVNLYTGPTTISGGTLVIGSTGSIDASTSLIVAAGAKLDTTAVATHTLPSTVAIGLDGDAETNGQIDASGQALDIDGAAVTFNVTGTLDAPSYVIAKYSSISGAAAFASITPPAGYTVDYGTGPAGEIRLVQAGTDYDDWMDLYPSLTGSDRLPTADPDGDGLTNEVEYAFALAPNSGASVNPITIQLDKTTGTFSYQRRSSTGLNYTIESSTDLATWNLASATQNAGTPDGNGVQTVTVTLTGAPLTADKLFVRVRAD